MIGSVACAEFEINEREEREILQYLENNFEISKEIPEGELAYCFILDNHSPECQGEWWVKYQTLYQEDNTIKLYRCNSTSDTFKYFIKFFYDRLTTAMYRLYYYFPGMSMVDYYDILKYEDISEEEYFSRIVN